MNPKQKLAALLSRMQAIVDNAKAAGRDLTDAEIVDLEAKNAEVVDLKTAIERGEKAAALIGRIGTMKDGYDPTDPRSVLPGPGGWAKKAVADFRALSKANGAEGVKSVMSGSFSVPALLSPSLMDAAPRSVLDLIPRPTAPGRTLVVGDDSGDVGFVGRGDREGNDFTYLRQLSRENNAAAVPDLEEKPTSVYSFDEVTDKFRVYANKTEPMPWRYLADYSALEDILRAQLADDTLAAIEADVISGDGEDDAFTGILETVGLLVENFSDDLITTLSNAKYALTGRERNLTGWAFNPHDLKAIELLRENGTTGAFLFKSRDEIEAFLGAPVVTSLGIPAGTAIAADWNQAELLPVGDDELVFDTTQRTVNNTFLFMFEGRYGFRVKTPSDFVKVALTE